MSAATPSNSQRAGPASGNIARAASTTVLSSAGETGLQMSVATSDMGGTGCCGYRAVLIAGPTASGKSALALALAEATGGVIINADSMQVYRDLSVITARPTAADEARAPHRLYGDVDAAINCSVGIWLEQARGALFAAERERRLPIVVGGTGLYFKALLRGLSAIPPIPAEVREAIRARLARDGIEALHEELSRRDPASAARLKPRDRARIPRALEVIEATGRPIGEWHREGLPPLLRPEEVNAVFVAPDRAALYQRIDQRFAEMLAGGAIEEVAALAARGLDPLLPAMKAHGVRVLMRYLNGEIALDEVARLGATETRHYAKRQFTWFRHQLAEFVWAPPGEAANLLNRGKNIIARPHKTE
jgi:tRNA dimethylallyltransferase